MEFPATLRRCDDVSLFPRQDGDRLQTTELVHEAFLRLVDQPLVGWRSRGQFYGVAAKGMRSILIDHARSRRAVKRGRGRQRLTLRRLACASSRS
jgi:hypothetical protein